MFVHKKKWPEMPTVNLDILELIENENIRSTSFVAKWKQQAKKDKWQPRRLKQVTTPGKRENLWSIIPGLIDYCE